MFRERRNKKQEAKIRNSSEKDLFSNAANSKCFPSLQKTFHTNILCCHKFYDLRFYLIILHWIMFQSVKLLSGVWLFAHQASLSSPHLELAQTNVHWVDDAIQTSHPLSSPSLPAFNFSQHQGLFQWVGSSHEMAKLLELQFQHQSFWWTFRIDFL